MRLLATLVVLGIVLVSYTATGAEFRIAQQNPKYPNELQVYLIGEIKSGDYEKFVSIVRPPGKKVRGVELRSQGGNGYEAMRIGRAVRALMLDTSAPISEQGCAIHDRESGVSAKPCTCASACFFVFVGGVRRTGLELVLHRARFTNEEMARLTHDQYKQAYEKILEVMKSYLREMDVPEKFFNQMIAISSQESKKISATDALELMTTPASDEWLSARCGMFTEAEMLALSQLYIQRSQGAHVDPRIKQLETRMNAINYCRNDRIDEARDEALRTFRPEAIH
jgi:hypothetical protein